MLGPLRKSLQPMDIYSQIILWYSKMIFKLLDAATCSGLVLMPDQLDGNLKALSC